MKYEQPDLSEFILSRDVLIPLENIEFDHEGKQGQARKLDVIIARERYQDILKNKPDCVQDVKLWEKQAGVF